LKAVVYHADAHDPSGTPVGDQYQKLFKGLNTNCHKYGLQTVQVTLEGHPCWADEAYYVSGLDPKNMMLNREICFTDFLKNAPEDVYWFTEPDYRIWKNWPPLKEGFDCALLLREGDGVPLNPSWRMATKKALPLFEEFRDECLKWPTKYDWHCDSEAFVAVHKKMGRPNRTVDSKTYLGVAIEFRLFHEYVKPNPVYGRNYAGRGMKKELLRAEGG
jgi:hypothetical protein